MFDLLKKTLGIGDTVDFAALVAQGAKIVDVRSKEEFQEGHIKESLNAPLQSLPGGLSGVAKDRVVITCCASGMRSANAKRILESDGFKQVHNGGGWRGLQAKLG